MKYFVVGVAVGFGLLSCVQLEAMKGKAEIDRLKSDALIAANEAFSTKNLLEDGISEEGLKNWNEFLNDTDLFLDGMVVKKGKDALKQIMQQIKDASNDLTETIKEVRLFGNDFKKEEYGTIKFGFVKDNITRLGKQQGALKELKKKASPGILESADIKNFKNLLVEAIDILQRAYEKVQQDFDNIKGFIRLAIDSKKYSNK